MASIDLNSKDIVKFKSITPTEFNVKAVNQIKDLYPKQRQDSKAPTFALTYLGTWRTLVKNCGFSPEKSMSIEKNYHTLYEHSDQWLKAALDEAGQSGYVNLAFGFKLRTPLLKQVVLDSRSAPYEAQKESRTAGNALSGQSYGLLNNRAGAAFMERVRASEYRHDVKCVAVIHDAIYLLIRDDVKVVEWVNNTLIEEMSWQKLPEIQHDQVKISAGLDLFHPNWSKKITLKNFDTAEGIKTTVRNHLNKGNQNET